MGPAAAKPEVWLRDHKTIAATYWSRGHLIVSHTKLLMDVDIMQFSKHPILLITIDLIVNENIMPDDNIVKVKVTIPPLINLQDSNP